MSRKITVDAPILTTEEIGPNTSLTPEGFLLCRDVPIARTGEQIYGENEIPAEAGPDKIIHVQRPPEEVFRPETMASFEGKPVTNNHPPDLLTPETWKQYVVGTVSNVRRQDNLMVADLLVADAGSIRDIQQGLREVSCGYDADYEQVSPGHAIQRDIVGNHVALVPKGRCGPTCAISDSKPEEKKTMKKKKGIMDRIRAAFSTRDEEELKKALTDLEGEEGEGRELHVHLHGAEGEDEEPEMTTKEMSDAIRDLLKDKASRDKGGKDGSEKDSFEELVNHLVEKGYSKEYTTKIAGKVAEEKGDDSAPKDADPDGEGEEEFCGDAMPTLLSRAEILSPGIKLAFPTGDAKSKEFKKGVCDCKRQALKAAYASDAGRKAVDAILGGRCIDKLSPSALDAVFMGASALMGAKNNQGAGSGAARTTKDWGKPRSISEMNAANKTFWDQRKAK